MPTSETFYERVRQEQDRFSGLSIMPYANFPGVNPENYVAVMGHSPNITLPGLFSVSRIARNAPILDCGNSAEVRTLTRLAGKEIILVELVPQRLVDLSFEAIAHAVEGLIVDPENTVISPVLNGGLGLQKELETRIPGLKAIDHQPVQVQRTYGGTLGEIKLLQGFRNVGDKHVFLIEDLGDEGLTLQYLIEQAKRGGALNVSVVMHMNKIGVEGKVSLDGALQVVGIGLPNLWIGGGKGPDIQDGLCRDFPNIVAKFTMDQWRDYKAQNGW